MFAKDVCDTSTPTRFAYCLQGNVLSVKGDVQRVLKTISSTDPSIARSISVLAEADLVKGRMEAARDTLQASHCTAAKLYQ